MNALKSRIGKLEYGLNPGEPKQWVVVYVEDETEDEIEQLCQKARNNSPHKGAEETIVVRHVSPPDRTKNDALPIRD